MPAKSESESPDMMVITKSANHHLSLAIGLTGMAAGILFLAFSSLQQPWWAGVFLCVISAGLILISGPIVLTADRIAGTLTIENRRALASQKSGVCRFGDIVAIEARRGGLGGVYRTSVLLKGGGALSLTFRRDAVSPAEAEKLAKFIGVPYREA
jgi:hypothetical protein